MRLTTKGHDVSNGNMHKYSGAMVAVVVVILPALASFSYPLPKMGELGKSYGPRPVQTSRA